MSDESRADRLRRRRAQRDQQGESTESSQQSEPAKLSESSEPSEPSDPSTQSAKSESVETTQTTGDATDSPAASESESVKATRVGTYMYLPENQRSTLDFRYKELNLAYERTVGDELEKNRHFYPLVIQAGLEALDGADGEEIQERLMQFK